jgi:hypothetical protein
MKRFLCALAIVLISASTLHAQQDDTAKKIALMKQDLDGVKADIAAVKSDVGDLVKATNNLLAMMVAEKAARENMQSDLQALKDQVAAMAKAQGGTFQTTTSGTAGWGTSTTTFNGTAQTAGVWQPAAQPAVLVNASYGTTTVRRGLFGRSRVRVRSSGAGYAVGASAGSS